MVDVIVNQRLLSLTEGLLDGMELLRQIDTGPAVREHLDHLVKVTFGPLEALDDAGMRFVNMIFHGDDHIPSRDAHPDAAGVGPARIAEPCLAGLP